MIEVITLINSAAIVILAVLVIRLIKSKSRVYQSQIETSGSEPSAMISNREERLPLKSGDKIPAHELSKITVTAQLSVIRWLELKIYNGTECELRELDVRVTASRDNQEPRSRMYRLIGDRLMGVGLRAKPYSWSEYKLQENEHDIESGENIELDVVGARIK